MISDIIIPGFVDHIDVEISKVIVYLDKKVEKKMIRTRILNDNNIINNGQQFIIYLKIDKDKKEYSYTIEIYSSTSILPDGFNFSELLG